MKLGNAISEFITGRLSWCVKLCCSEGYCRVLWLEGKKRSWQSIKRCVLSSGYSFKREHVQWVGFLRVFIAGNGMKHEGTDVR